MLSNKEATHVGCSRHRVSQSLGIWLIDLGKAIDYRPEAKVLVTGLVRHFQLV